MDTAKKRIGMIAGMLGLRIGEEFEMKGGSSDGERKRYKFTEGGLKVLDRVSEARSNDNMKGYSKWIIENSGIGIRSWIDAPPHIMNEMVLGKDGFIPEDAIEEGMEYYYPTPFVPECVNVKRWENDKFDRLVRDRLGAYLKEDDAIKKAKEFGWEVKEDE